MHEWASNCARPSERFYADGVIGVYCGANTAPGTLQSIGNQLRGWENAHYVSRNPGSMQVIGGRFRNNNNNAARLAGENSFADGCSMLLDQRAYNVEEMPGEYKPGEVQGINGIRSENRKGDEAGCRVANCEIVVNKVQKLDGFRCGGLAAPIQYENTVGAGRIENCEITTHVDGRPAILAENPGGNADGPRAIEISNIKVMGTATGSPAISVAGRPNSIVRDSCIQLPGVTSSTISGARKENVGYGSNCEPEQGLSGPVGAPGNISNLSVPPGGFGGFTEAERQGIVARIVGYLTSAIGAFFATVVVVLVTLLVAFIGLFYVGYRFIRGRTPSLGFGDS
jgi:hypothetical protein